MPQINLEYTKNISIDGDIEKILVRIHEILVSEADALLGECKSKVTRIDRYVIGNGEGNSSYVFVGIRLLTGRSIEIRKKIGAAVTHILQTEIKEKMGHVETQIRVEISEIDRDLYWMG